MAGEVNPAERLVLTDACRLIITVEDSDVVTWLRSDLEAYRHLFCAQITAETSSSCGCLTLFDSEEIGSMSEDELCCFLQMISVGRCHHVEVLTGYPISFSLVHLAAAMNKPQTVYFLVSLDKKLADCDMGSEQITPLFTAIHNCNPEVVKCLLDCGADVNLPVYDMTPLVFSIRESNWPAFQLLISSPQCVIDDASMPCFNTVSPLYVAVRKKELRMVKRLLEAGANPNKSRRAICAAVSNENCEIVRALIEAGAKVDVSDNDGVTDLLIKAFQRENVELGRILLEAGCDPRAVCDDGYPLLVLAASTNRSDFMQLLLDFHADPNQTNEASYTALHYAAWEGRRRNAEILLASGAEHDLRTRDGNTPLSLAAHGDHYSLVELLLPRGCHVTNADKDLDTAIHYAAYNGCLRTVRALVAAGADPDVKNRCNATPLWNAVYQGHSDVVRYLVRQNVELDVASVGINQHSHTVSVQFVYQRPRTPLWVAVVNGYPEILDILVTAGYDIWREKWVDKLVTTDGSGDDETAMIGELTLSRRLTALYSTPPSLLHRCKMFFRKTYRSRLEDMLIQLQIPNTLKDFVILEGIDRADK